MPRVTKLTSHMTMQASAEDWGETLDAEQLRGGAFLEQDQSQVMHHIIVRHSQIH